MGIRHDIASELEKRNNHKKSKIESSKHSQEQYQSYIDHPDVTLDLAIRFAKIIEQEDEYLEHDFLEKEFNKIEAGNHKSITKITSIHSLDMRLREIISISDEIDILYHDHFAKALFKKALSLSLIKDRIEWHDSTTGSTGNPELQMVLHMLDGITLSFLSEKIMIDKSEILLKENQEKVIERTGIFISGVIWTQSNCGKATHSLAKNASSKIIEENLVLNMEKLRAQ